MKGLVYLLSLLIFIGFYPTIEPSYSASKKEGSKVVKKISKSKKTKGKRIAKVRVRYASNVNKPKEGEYLKLEEMAKDMLNEQ